MNFITAIQHLPLGYGIRRKPWNKEAILMQPDQAGVLIWMYSHLPAKLRPDLQHPFTSHEATDSITCCDIIATDWETV
jgi:hypothetical protein